MGAGFIGFELFSNKAKYVEEYKFPKSHDEHGISPRINFDNFLNSFLAITQIAINEDWHLINFDIIRSTS